MTWRFQSHNMSNSSVYNMKMEVYILLLYDLTYITLL